MVGTICVKCTTSDADAFCVDCKMFLCYSCVSENHGDGVEHEIHPYCERCIISHTRFPNLGDQICDTCNASLCKSCFSTPCQPNATHLAKGQAPPSQSPKETSCSVKQPRKAVHGHSGPGRDMSDGEIESDHGESEDVSEDDSGYYFEDTQGIATPLEKKLEPLPELPDPVVPREKMVVATYATRSRAAKSSHRADVIRDVRDLALDAIDPHMREKLGGREAAEYLALSLVKSCTIRGAADGGTEVILELSGDARRLAAPLAEHALRLVTFDTRVEIRKIRVAGDVDGIDFAPLETRRKEELLSSCKSSQTHSEYSPPSSGKDGVGTASKKKPEEAERTTHSEAGRPGHEQRRRAGAMITCYVGGTCGLGALVGKEGRNRGQLLSEVVGVIQSALEMGRDEVERLRPAVDVDANEGRSVSVTVSGTVAAKVAADVANHVVAHVRSKVSGPVDIDVHAWADGGAEVEVGASLVREAKVFVQFDRSLPRSALANLIGKGASKVRELKSRISSMVGPAGVVSHFAIDAQSSFTATATLGGPARDHADEVAVFIEREIIRLCGTASAVTSVKVTGARTTRGEKSALRGAASQSGPIRRSWVGAPPPVAGIASSRGFSLFSHAAPKGSVDLHAAEISGAGIICFPSCGEGGINTANCVVNWFKETARGQWCGIRSLGKSLVSVILWDERAFSKPELPPVSVAFAADRDVAVIQPVRHIETGTWVVIVSASLRMSARNGKLHDALRQLNFALQNFISLADTTLFAAVDLAVPPHSYEYKQFVNHAMKPIHMNDVFAEDRSVARVSAVSHNRVADETNFLFASRNIQCTGRLVLPTKEHFLAENPSGILPNDYNKACSLPLFAGFELGQRS